jgi:crotonobetainyl-CoA:carnitine CoA-transferase CaiB-like acyl-CoA transferase
VNKVLDGVRVIDLSRVLAGPYCAQMLADFGADVIKVESPEGDENRKWLPVMPSGQSCNFASVNRGKRSITLNLKTPASREVIHRLVRQADVLLHSFLPQTAERLGITFDALHAINPRLIFCSISGYGAEGELADKRGYDLMVQAFTGVMSTTGIVDGPPMRCGVSFIDMSTGISTYGGIVTALLARERTGQGTWVRGSLMETSVALLGYHAVAWLQAGILPQPQGSGSWHLVPYQAFRCQDGYMLAGAPNDAAWARFCDALEWPELACDARFTGNAARVEQRLVLVPLLEERFMRRPVAYWIERFEARTVACAPLHTLDQVLTHPQLLANHMVVQATDPDGVAQDLVGTPFKLGDGGGTATSAPPTLGADTDGVLNEVLGFTPAEIASMHAAGTFAA